MCSSAGYLFFTQELSCRKWTTFITCHWKEGACIFFFNISWVLPSYVFLCAPHPSSSNHEFSCEIAANILHLELNLPDIAAVTVFKMRMPRFLCISFGFGSLLTAKLQNYWRKKIHLSFTVSVIYSSIHRSFFRITLITVKELYSFVFNSVILFSLILVQWGKGECPQRC